MKILKAHTRYQQRGGEDESFDTECAILAEQGHDVDLYVRDNHRIEDLSKWRAGLRAIWSTEDYQQLRDHLRATRPDVVHFHNTFPLLSPAVYYAARAERIPIVQTLPNYRLLCPSATFFRDGHVCQDCLGKFVPLPGIVHACYRGSRSASSSVATMLTLHRMLGTWKRMVDLYIALAEFGRRKFIEGGLPANKIVVKPNFVHPDPGPGTGAGHFAIFAGRLAEEKGLDTLLTAWERVGDRLPLKIVGEGPLAARVASRAERIPGVEWLGRKPVQEVYRLMGSATFLVFPSEWFEPLGRTIIESFAVGTPVLAAKLGAPSEMVTDGRTGYLFSPGDPDDLVAKTESLLAHPMDVRRMRQQAREEFLAKYSAETNLRSLLAIYEQAISHHRLTG